MSHATGERDELALLLCKNGLGWGGSERAHNTPSHHLVRCGNGSDDERYLAWMSDDMLTQHCFNARCPTIPCSYKKKAITGCATCFGGWVIVFWGERHNIESCGNRTEINRKQIENMPEIKVLVVCFFPVYLLSLGSVLRRFVL